MNHTSIITAIVLLCSCCLVIPAADDLKPGAHRKLACTGAADQTYDLYLPKAYGEKPDERFPVLFISSPGGNPGFLKLESWAERQNAVLVTINNSKNGPWEPIQAAQKAVTATAFATLRLHHCLRFSVGHSGAAWASGSLGEGFGDDWAGVVFCINSQRTATLKRHVACAYIAGTKDNVYGIELVRADMAKAKAAGNPVRIIERDVGHVGMSAEDISDMLDWMLEIGRIAHPRLTPAERKAGQEQLKQRIGALKTMTDDQARLTTARSLLSIDAVAKLPEAKELKESWLSALLSTTDDAKDPVAAHLALNEAARSPWIQGIIGDSRKSLDKRLSTLRSLPAVKADMDSRSALEQAKALENRAGTSRSLMQNVIAQYAAIAKRWPDTTAGAEARAAAERLASNKAK